MKDRPRALRCAGIAVEDRCCHRATRIREGWHVCPNHAKKKKFRVHPSAIRVPLSEFQIIGPDRYCISEGEDLYLPLMGELPP